MVSDTSVLEALPADIASHAGLLEDLQSAHDNSVHSREWHINMRQIAATRNLSTSTLTESLKECRW